MLLKGYEIEKRLKKLQRAEGCSAHPATIWLRPWKKSTSSGVKCTSLRRKIQKTKKKHNFGKSNIFRLR